MKSNKIVIRWILISNEEKRKIKTFPRFIAQFL